MIVSAIVAYCKDANDKQVIGKDNKLPWRIPQDMAWFKECTSGSAVIMGRKTHQSIGRLLPGRDNIILTRNETYRPPGAFVFDNLNDALKFASDRHSEVFVIGGQEIYEQTIDIVDRIYLTMVSKKYEGDAFFPAWNRGHFKVIHREVFDDPVNGKVTFKIFQRTNYRKHPASEVDTEVATAYNSTTGNTNGDGV